MMLTTTMVSTRLKPCRRLGLALAASAGWRVVGLMGGMTACFCVVLETKACRAMLGIYRVFAVTLATAVQRFCGC